MSEQVSIVEPYVVVFATYTLQGDTWGLAPDEPGPAAWAAIVRRAGNCARYAVHACHSTRAQVSEAGVGFIDLTFAMARGIEIVWILDVAAARTELQRADIQAARELAHKYAVTPHEPVVQVERAGAAQ